MLNDEEFNQITNSRLPSRRVIHALEVAVVAFIISSKALTWLIYVCRGSPGSPGQLTIAPDALILRNLQYIALIWFMAWRNSERLSLFGLVRPKFAADILIGVGVFLIAKAMQAAVIYIQMTESHAVDIASNISTSILRFNRESSFATIIIAMILVSCSEELIYRGYFLTRFRMITGSNVVAVLFSSVMFGISHWPMPITTIVGTALVGIVLGVIRVFRCSLWPSIFAHLINNIIFLTFYKSLINNN